MKTHIKPPPVRGHDGKFHSAVEPAPLSSHRTHTEPPPSIESEPEAVTEPELRLGNAETCAECAKLEKSLRTSFGRMPTEEEFAACKMHRCT